MVWYESYAPQVCVGAIIAIFVLIWLLSPDRPVSEVNISPSVPGYYTGTLPQVSREQDPLVENVIQPQCTSTVSCGRFESKGEKICRQVLEDHYGVPFPSIRPDWLKSGETKRNFAQNTD